MSTDDAVVDVPATDEWQRLVGHFESIRHRHLRQFFADDPGRGTRMTVTAGDLYLDYSKHRATAETMAALMEWPGGQGSKSAATPCSPAGA